MPADVILNDDNVEVTDSLIVRGGVHVRGPDNLRVDLDDGGITFQGETSGGGTTSGSLSVRKLAFIEQILCGELSAHEVATRTVEVGTGSPGEPSDDGRVVVKDARGDEGVVLDGRIGAVSARRPFQTLSDVRCKSQVRTIDNAVATVRELRGVRFEWADRADPTPDLGLIAQEVEQVLPETVAAGPNGQRSISYSGVVPVLVEAVKEQAATIDRQRNTMRWQEERLAALEERLMAIEERVAAEDP